MAEFGRKGKAVWEGNLQRGKGRVSTESGALSDASYGFKTRFGREPGTNPEELIAAAHAACFSMALAGELADAGYTAERIETDATCTISSVDDGFAITRMQLDTRVSVPDIDEQEFMRLANHAKENCPVSKALRAVDVDLRATLANS